MKATQPNTPSAPASEPSELYEAALRAAARVGQSLPSILDLGRHMADMEHAEAAIDEADNGPGSEASVRLRWATDLLSDRRDALADLIATQPATSLADAAVQIAVMVDYAEQFPDAGDSHDGRRINHLSSMIARMALSILPVVAKAADLDLERMAWTGPAHSMRVARFAGVGVQS